MAGSRSPGGDPVLVVTTGRSLDSVLRAASLAMELDRLGLGARVLTAHPRAAEIEALTGRNLVWLPDHAWPQAAPRYLAMASPKVAVIDGFPFGRTGELLAIPPFRGDPPRLVHLAVRIPFGEYLGAIGAQWERDGARFARVVQAGPLEADHQAALAGSPVTVLADPIRLPRDRLSAEADLATLVGPGSPWLSEAPSGGPMAASAVAALV